MKTKISAATARSYVAGLDVPAPPATRTRSGKTRGLTREVTRGDSLEPAFETAKNQAAVVGSDVVSFVAGVTPERRRDIVNSSLLAQLMAKRQVSDANDVAAWYDAYFEVLTRIGWVIQDRSFAEYREASEDFAAHQAILAVAAVLLGPAPAALAVVKTTLDALRSMSDESPWITLFDRESRSGKAARFQISLAEQEKDGRFLVSLMAFSLVAKAKLTQVLFFKARSNEVTLRQHSGRVTIATHVLEAVREPIKAKLAGWAQDFVKALPDLGKPPRP